MESIGKLLRETRERLGLTQEEVERATRIRCRYLQALEDGDLDSLPSPVQSRGFLRNYADFLGLDPDAVLLQYAEAIHGLAEDNRRGAEPSAQRARVQVQARGPSWFSSDLLVAVAISLTVLVVLIWGGSRVFAAVRQDGQAPNENGLDLMTAPSPTQTATASATVQEEVESAPAAPVVTPAGEETLPAELIGEGETPVGVNVRVLVEKRAWMEVSVDGEPAFAGRVAPGEILEYQGSQQVRLLTGNGGGLRIVYNGQDQGRLGAVGEVVSRLWDLTGAITPTPTPSLTPTPTRAQSETPTTVPSATASPTLIP